MNHNMLLGLLILLPALLSGYADAYYSGIDPDDPTFINDLKTRVRSPYTRIYYSQFDETNIANYASRDNGDGTRSVDCVYTGYEYVYSGTFSWDVLSREHSWCYSWMPSHGSENTDEYADQHHLFPTHQNNANGRRSNHPLGEVATPTYIYLDGRLGYDSDGDLVYEPRDEHKGEAARALFYMCIRYDGTYGNTWNFNWLNNTLLPSISEDDQNLNLLLQWHQLDPPDRWELERNDYIQSIQQNRNPFVDHPEWVSYIDFNDLSLQNPTYASEPVNHVTALNASAVSALTLRLSWNHNLNRDVDGFLVIAFDEDNFWMPQDGVTYSQDTSLADGIATVLVPSTASTGYFYDFSGLTDNQEYWFVVYPYNGSGTSINYKTDGTVPNTTGTAEDVVLGTPVALPASGSTTTGFTANWQSASGATGYYLDVATAPTFSPGSSAILIDEDFTSGVPAGWTNNGSATDNYASHAGPSGIPCRAMGTGDQLITPEVDNPQTLSFYSDSSSGGDGETAEVRYSIDGGSWFDLSDFTVSTDGQSHQIDLATNWPAIATAQNVAFSFESTFYTWYLDDVLIEGIGGESEFVIQNQYVGIVTQYTCSVDTANKDYYYRLRATDGSRETSSNSNTITATTLAEVTSAASATVTESSITSGGEILAGGGSSILSSGLCYTLATNPDPTLTDDFTTDGPAAPGTITSTISGLAPGTIYKVRAYGVNNGGASYGAVHSFSTAPAGGNGSSGEGSVNGNSTGGDVSLPPVNLGGNLTTPGVNITGASGDGSFTLLVSDATPAQMSGQTLLYRFSGPSGIFQATIFQLLHTGYGTPMTQAVYSVDGGNSWIVIQGLHGTVVPGDGNSITIQNFDPQGIGRADLQIVLGAEDSTLPVTLSGFNAAQTAAGFVSISWVTQSETDLAGFHLWRSKNQDVQHAGRITNLMIDATGGSEPESYQYTDEYIEPQTTYCYWLESVEFGGNSSMYGPVTLTTGSGEDPGDVPDSQWHTALLLNYPNPFNPETIIVFSLSGEASVEMVIYNTKGQQVRLLLPFQVLEMGAHKYNWDGLTDDGKAAGSGIYLCRLLVDGKAFSRKLMLLK